MCQAFLSSIYSGIGLDIVKNNMNVSITIAVIDMLKKERSDMAHTCADTQVCPYSSGEGGEAESAIAIASI